MGKDQNLVGSSFHAKRSTRFSGKSKLFITSSDFINKESVELHFSQIHDIIGINGERSVRPQGNLKFLDVYDHLKRNLGASACSGKIYHRSSADGGRTKSTFKPTNLKNFF